jgi:hypothetical protein
VGDKIEDCVARFDVGPSLPGGVWSQRSFPEQPGATSPSDQVINMKKEIAGLRDRISSNSISIDSFIHLSFTWKDCCMVYSTPPWRRGLSSFLP